MELPELPPFDQLGPKMQALRKDEQRLFVWAYVNNGGNATQAANDAGYGKGGNGQHSTGWRLTQRQDVKEAMHECTWLVMHTAAVPAVKALEHLVRDPNHKDHARAIEMVLARTGFLAKSEHTTKVEHVLDERTMLARIVALCEKNKWDKQAILGASAPQVKQIALPSAKYIEAEVIDGSEGLEDILG